MDNDLFDLVSFALELGTVSMKICNRVI